MPGPKTTAVLMKETPFGHRTELADVSEGRSGFRVLQRPWGSIQYMGTGERFSVKRILVEPRATMSLHLHHHRSEHWIVVKGTVEITVDDEVRTVYENQSAYVPMCSTHRVSNPGIIPAELIEVQTGCYLGEDDLQEL